MKKYLIRILHIAEDDLLNLIQYVGRYSPSAAATLADDIKDGINALEEMPRKYPIYDRQPIFRKLAVKDVLIFYVIHEEPAKMEIYRIIHGKRDLV